MAQADVAPAMAGSGVKRDTGPGAPPVTSGGGAPRTTSEARVSSAFSDPTIRTTLTGLDATPPPKPRMMPFAINSLKKIPLQFAQKDVMPKQPVKAKDSEYFNEIHRIHSALWNDESVPFKLYEVQKRPAQMLDVHVIRGKGITKGWFRDIMESPDPYLLLRIPGTPNGVKRTKTVANKKDPMWDEHFHFYIDPYCTPKLEVKLMDSHYIVDQNMGVATVPLEKIIVNDPAQTRELGFLNNSKVYITVMLEEAKEPADIRVGQALSREERAFLARRRRRVAGALQRLLGADDAAAPRGVKDTPCVAVLGSGGGFRATAAFAGALKALHAAGLLDCATFLAGVSGSTWYLSYLYSHLPRSPAALEQDLRERMCGGWRHLLMPRNLCRYLTLIGRKAAQGQPIAFTDLFGHLVGDTLLGEKSKNPLSAQREVIQEAEAPLPIYSCVHVNRDISAQVFQEWVDFTPYDVCMEKYGASMKTEAFGNKMYCGYAIKKFPELPISFLMGLWGSAFSILFKRLVWDRDKTLSYFCGSTAENERRAADDINAFRAAREGYASSNNDTGSSNESLKARSEDEQSSDDDDAERARLRESMVAAMAEEALRRERERREERASRVSKKSRGDDDASKKEKKTRISGKDDVAETIPDLDLWMPKKKERKFRNFIQGLSEAAARAQRGEARAEARRAARLLAARVRHAAVGGRVGHAHGPRGPHLQPAARPRAAPHLPARARAADHRQGHGADEGHVHAVGPAQQALVRGGRRAGAQPALPAAAAAAARRRRVHRLRLLGPALGRRVALRAGAAGGELGAPAQPALPARREAGEALSAGDSSRVLSLRRREGSRLPYSTLVSAHQPQFPEVQSSRRGAHDGRGRQVRRLPDLLGHARHLLHHQLPLQRQGVRAAGGAHGVQRAVARAARDVGAARRRAEEARAAAARRARRAAAAGGARRGGAGGGAQAPRAAPQGARAQEEAAGAEARGGERGGDAAAARGQEAQDAVGSAARAPGAAPALHQGAGGGAGRGGGHVPRPRAARARHAAHERRLQVGGGERAPRRRADQGNKALLRRAVASFSAEIDATSADSNAPRCERSAGLESVTTTAASVETRSVRHSITECLALHRHFKCSPRGFTFKHLKTCYRILMRFCIARVNSSTAAVDGSIERSSALPKHVSPLKEQKRIMRQNLREFSKGIKSSFASILLRHFVIVYPMEVMAKYHSSTGNYVIVGSTDIWIQFPAFQYLRESVLVIFQLECSSPKTPHLPYDFPVGIRPYNSSLIISHHTPQHLSEIRSRLFHQGYVKDADFSLQDWLKDVALWPTKRIYKNSQDLTFGVTKTSIIQDLILLITFYDIFLYLHEKPASINGNIYQFLVLYNFSFC